MKCNSLLIGTEGALEYLRNHIRVKIGNTFTTRMPEGVVHDLYDKIVVMYLL